MFDVDVDEDEDVDVDEDVGCLSPAQQHFLLTCTGCSSRPGGRQSTQRHAPHSNHPGEHR